MDRSRIAFVATLIAVSVALAGFTYIWLSAQRPGGGTQGDLSVEFASVRTQLPWPIALAFSSDGRVFYAERFTGKIQILGNATNPATTTFFTIPEIATAGEQGLLGLALDPGFPDSPYVYAYYTRADVANASTYNRIVRIASNGSVGSGMQVLRDRLAANTLHNSGVIAFGPDGTLYALVGDAGDIGAPQDRLNPNGKVLRMNPNGSVPPDNPFVGSPTADPYVYTYGHRNMFGIAFQPGTGRPYATENGPQCNDEVNRLVAGGNYGWGPNATCSEPPAPPANTNRDGANPILPVAWYDPVVVPTNAAFYTAPVPATSLNHLVVGTFDGHRLHELTLDAADGATVVRETILATAPEGIVDVEMGFDGLLWITTPTAIYRLVPVPVTTYALPLFAGPIAVLAWTGLVHSAAPVEPSRVRRHGRKRTPPRKP